MRDHQPVDLRGAHLRPRALEAAAMRRAMPSSMRDVARGFCCASSSNAPCSTLKQVEFCRH